MIDAALGQIARQLNLTLRRTLRSDEDLVVLSNILEQDGTPSSGALNRLVLCLVTIEQDTVAHQAGRAAGTMAAALSAPALHLNLRVMLAANHAGTHYAEGLKVMGQAIAFLQSRPVFDHQNTPELDDRFERLVLEMETLGLADQSHLWGMISNRVLPSVLYRVRMLTVDGRQRSAQVPLVGDPQGRVTR